MIKLKLPEALAKMAAENPLDLEIDNVNDFERALAQTAPALHEVLYQNGQLHGFANLYVNDKLVQDDKRFHKLSSDDVLSLLVAISGG